MWIVITIAVVALVLVVCTDPVTMWECPRCRHLNHDKELYCRGCNYRREA